MLSVRAATAEDLAAVAALAAARRREAMPSGQAPPPGPLTELEASHWGGLIAGAFGQPSTVLFVLDAGGQVAGYAAAGVVDGLAGVPEGSLADVYVAPALRRRGCGAALARACETALRARGCLTMVAQVPAWSGAARALAARLGYDVERLVLSRPAP